MDGLDGKPCYLGTGNFVHENDCIWIQDMYSTIYTSSLPETKSEFTSSENQTSWKMIHFLLGLFGRSEVAFLISGSVSSLKSTNNLDLSGTSKQYYPKWRFNGDLL